MTHLPSGEMAGFDAPPRPRLYMFSRVSGSVVGASMCCARPAAAAATAMQAAAKMCTRVFLVGMVVLSLLLTASALRLQVPVQERLEPLIHVDSIRRIAKPVRFARIALALEHLPVLLQDLDGELILPERSADVGLPVHHQQRSFHVLETR